MDWWVHRKLVSEPVGMLNRDSYQRADSMEAHSEYIKKTNKSSQVLRNMT